MFQRQIIFISLLIIFVGSSAQELRSNNQSRNEGRQIIDRQARTSQSGTQRSVQNGDTTMIRRDNNAEQLSPNQAKSSDEKPVAPLPASTSLVDSKECKADIQRYCGKTNAKPINNLRVLQCIDDLDNAVNLISKECQNRIYKLKYDMTHNVNFDNAAMRHCKKDLKLLEDCNNHTDERGTGRLISCLYDLLDNITELNCRNYINHIQSIVFTDWRLSEDFATACLADITKVKCGRLDEENDTLPHEQGAVISCLTKSHTTLSKSCLKHISRLAEMQSDDYHLDRALYFACREDRERFCSQVTSGNGRVYRCLYEQKLNNLMSAACREEVHRRQKLLASNALLDAPLVRACKSEMSEHRCVVNKRDSDTQLSLVNLLLCLENRMKKGNYLNDKCRGQILIHRRMLMSDYAVSPKIISECRNEMIEHCSSLNQQGVNRTIDQRGGRMIHCLFRAARQEKNFSSECLATIKSLVRAVNPGSDIRVDPLLEMTCRPVIDALCSKIKPGDSNIILCLLDNLKNSRMTEDCEDRLMDVAYFMARDWRLTPRLFKTCRTSLESLCGLSSGNLTKSEQMKNVRVGEYLSCLHQHKNQLDSECRSVFQRLLRIRSQSVGLMPEIEEHCRTDLATCKNPEVMGEEMKCLQKKYNRLELECKSAIQKFTKMTMTDPTLDFPMMKACESVIQLLCLNIQKGNENELLRCLIKQKNSARMDYRCRARIEHHQIISLKDEAFLSEQFRKRCDQEIKEHCSNKKTKSAVVQCLAHLMLRDVIKNLKVKTLTNECREELKFELLQRSESINFDPSLARACQNDIGKLCGTRNPGNAQILDCLKANRNKVSASCYRRLNQREKVDVILPDNDYSLITKCGPAIQKFCANDNKQNILSCLRRNANRDTTSNLCRTVLYHRLMVLNSDARFNQALIQNCQNDIQKYCRGEVIDDDNDDNDDDDDDADDNDGGDQKDDTNDGEVKDRDMGGRIIGCLRTKYANKNVDLSSDCTRELIDVIHASKLDVQFDVKLYQKCKTILEKSCLGLEKEDCLKVLYQKNQINDPDCKVQVTRIIREGQADIYVDQGLTIACQADLVKYCNDIPMGGGKQLQCLLKTPKSRTPSCQKMLLKRQELWSTISDVDDIDDLTRHIVNSSNSRYLYSVILTILFFIFLAGCICRPCLRYRRANKYK